MLKLSIHPLVDNGLRQGVGNFAGGKLFCHCPTDKVEVRVVGDVAHSHVCGCSKCWRPEGAAFAVVAVVPSENLTIAAHEEKLFIVDPTAAIERHACRQCGVHMFGRIVKEHPFKGLDFVHVELSDQKGWQEPQFAAFVSSIIEQGFSVQDTEEARKKLRSLGLEPYDVLSPPLMDAIAQYHAEKVGAPMEFGDDRPMLGARYARFDSPSFYAEGNVVRRLDASPQPKFDWCAAFSPSRNLPAATRRHTVRSGTPGSGKLLR